MAMEFNRIITLLRKEQGITQKQAAADLGISQALLSHYEKGIRECGLDFVVRVADYYGVSCDYLLGRSVDRSGLTLKVEDIPNPETAKDGIYRNNALAPMNKKFISNSLNILFTNLAKCTNKALVREISKYLMLAVYNMFRLMYSASPKNTQSMFRVDQTRWKGYSSAAMLRIEANIEAILQGQEIGDEPPFKEQELFAMTTESLKAEYPLYQYSLLNIIKVSEEAMENKE